MLVAINVQLTMEGARNMVGAKLRQLRQEKKYSLRALAKVTGLSHSFICDVEHGRCNPSLQKLHVLAQALGVKPEIFLTSMVANNDQYRNVCPTGTDGS